MDFSDASRYFCPVQNNTLQIGAAGSKVSEAQAAQLVAQALPVAIYQGKKILLIVPDHTRTAPVGLLFKSIFAQIGAVTKELDVLTALGTHPPMSESAICERLEISVEQHRNEYKKVRFFNHEWDNPAALQKSAHSPKPT
jgi:nickel-dependent lactate racemase